MALSFPLRVITTVLQHSMCLLVHARALHPFHSLSHQLQYRKIPRSTARFVLCRRL